MFNLIPYYMDRRQQIEQMAGKEQKELLQSISAYYSEFDEEGIDEEGLILLHEVAYKVYELCEYVAENRI